MAPPQRESPELDQVGEEEQDHHDREADPQDAARGRRDATLHGVLLSRYGETFALLDTLVYIVY